MHSIEKINQSNGVSEACYITRELAALPLNEDSDAAEFKDQASRILRLINLAKEAVENLDRSGLGNY
jgi:hypothetical protein